MKDRKFLVLFLILNAMSLTDFGCASMDNTIAHVGLGSESDNLTPPQPQCKKGLRAGYCTSTCITSALKGLLYDIVEAIKKIKCPLLLNDLGIKGDSPIYFIRSNKDKRYNESEIEGLMGVHNANNTDDQQLGNTTYDALQSSSSNNLMSANDVALPEFYSTTIPETCGLKDHKEFPIIQHSVSDHIVTGENVDETEECAIPLPEDEDTGVCESGTTLINELDLDRRPSDNTSSKSNSTESISPILRRSLLEPRTPRVNINTIRDFVPVDKKYNALAVYNTPICRGWVEQDDGGASSILDDKPNNTIVHAPVCKPVTSRELVVCKDYLLNDNRKTGWMDLTGLYTNQLPTAEGSNANGNPGFNNIISAKPKQIGDASSSSSHYPASTPKAGSNPRAEVPEALPEFYSTTIPETCGLKDHKEFPIIQHSVSDHIVTGENVDETEECAIPLPEDEDTGVCESGTTLINELDLDRRPSDNTSSKSNSTESISPILRRSLLEPRTPRVNINTIRDFVPVDKKYNALAVYNTPICRGWVEQDDGASSILDDKPNNTIVHAPVCKPVTSRELVVCKDYLLNDNRKTGWMDLTGLYTNQLPTAEGSNANGNSGFNNIISAKPKQVSDISSSSSHYPASTPKAGSNLRAEVPEALPEFYSTTIPETCGLKDHKEFPIIQHSVSDHIVTGENVDETEECAIPLPEDEDTGVCESGTTLINELDLDRRPSDNTSSKSNSTESISPILRRSVLEPRTRTSYGMLNSVQDYGINPGHVQNLMSGLYTIKNFGDQKYSIDLPNIDTANLNIVDGITTNNWSTVLVCSTIAVPAVILFSLHLRAFWNSLKSFVGDVFINKDKKMLSKKFDNKILNRNISKDHLMKFVISNMSSRDNEVFWNIFYN